MHEHMMEVVSVGDKQNDPRPLLVKAPPANNKFCIDYYYYTLKTAQCHTCVVSRVD